MQQLETDLKQEQATFCFALLVEFQASVALASSIYSLKFHTEDVNVYVGSMTSRCPGNEP